MRTRALVAVVAWAVPAVGAGAGAKAPPRPGAVATVSAGLPRAGGNLHYSGNRDPLLPSPLVKLPLGSVKAEGWLKTQIDLMAEGFTGRLPELSRFCKFEGNAWTDPRGEGGFGWEEVPYWLKGFVDPREPRAHRGLGRRRPDVARRQPRAVLPGARAVLPADARRAVPAGERARLRHRDGPLRPVPGRRLRRGRERAARLPGPAPGHGELHLRRADALARDARPDHGRREVGGPRRGRGLQLAARRDDPRPEGPALPDRRQHGAARPEEQGPALRQRRGHALLQPVAVPLLPAQRRLRVAVFRREPVDGHRRQRPRRRPLRAGAGEGEGGPRRRRGPRGADRLPVRRHHRDHGPAGRGHPVPAVAASPCVGEERDPPGEPDPRPRARGPAGVGDARPALAARRPGAPHPAHGRAPAALGEKPEHRLGGPRAAHLFARDPAALGPVQRGRTVAGLRGLPAVAVELRPRPLDPDRAGQGGRAPRRAAVHAGDRAGHAESEGTPGPAVAPGGERPRGRGPGEPCPQHGAARGPGPRADGLRAAADHRVPGGEGRGSIRLGRGSAARRGLERVALRAALRHERRAGRPVLGRPRRAAVSLVGPLRHARVGTARLPTPARGLVGRGVLGRRRGGAQLRPRAARRAALRAHRRPRASARGVAAAVLGWHRVAAGVGDGGVRRRPRPVEPGELRPVVTTGLRIEAQLRPRQSAGVVEWRVGP